MSDRIVFESSGCPAFALPPLAPGSAGPARWIWYAITTGDYPNAILDGYFGRLRRFGFWIVGVDVGDTYASPLARAQFERFYSEVRRRFGLGPRARLLVQSRGALDGLAFAAQFPERVERIAGIYPVLDYRSYPGAAKAAETHHLTEAAFQQELPKLNPLHNLKALAEAGIPLFLLHGDRDRIVPLELNSLPAEQAYKLLGGPVHLEVVPGFGHEEVPAFFQSEALLDFLTAG